VIEQADESYMDLAPANGAGSYANACRRKSVTKTELEFDAGRDSSA
jgi:hypothetical protein